MWNDTIRLLSDPSNLTPHGFCLLWDPGLIWTYAVSDIGIGVAYFTIPLALAVFVRRRRDLVFRPGIALDNEPLAPGMEIFYKPGAVDTLMARTSALLRRVRAA